MYMQVFLNTIPHIVPITLICFRIPSADFLVVGMKHGIGIGTGTGKGTGVGWVYMDMGTGT